MGENSKIEWTDHTANFWWGCQKVSPGCANCYASNLSRRFGKKIWGPPATTSREMKKNIWDELPRWNRQAEKSGKRKFVFVQSMSDFFEDHPDVGEWRDQAIGLMQDCKNLTFLVLTKRIENVIEMIETSKSHSYSDASMWFCSNPHIWVGASIENKETAAARIPELKKIPTTRFLSIEPLLESLGQIDLTDIHWVIVGGESGSKARPMHPDWVREIRDQCQEANVLFFFKQWGAWIPAQLHPMAVSKHTWNHNIPCLGWCSHDAENGKWSDWAFCDGNQVMWKVGKKKSGRILDGREWNEMPGEEK